METFPRAHIKIRPWKIQAVNLFLIQAVQASKDKVMHHTHKWMWCIKYANDRIWIVSVTSIYLLLPIYLLPLPCQCWALPYQDYMAVYLDVDRRGGIKETNVIYPVKILLWCNLQTHSVKLSIQLPIFMIGGVKSRETESCLFPSSSCLRMRCRLRSRTAGPGYAQAYLLFQRHH